MSYVLVGHVVCVQPEKTQQCGVFREAWHGVGGLGRVLGVLVWESLGLLGSGWNAGTKKDGVCASLF